MVHPSQFPPFIPKTGEDQTSEKKHRPSSGDIQFWAMQPCAIKPQAKIPPSIKIPIPPEPVSDEDESPGPLPGRCQLIRRSHISRPDVLAPSEKMFGSQIDYELEQLMQNRSELASSGKGKRKSTEEEEQKVQVIATVSQKVLSGISETPAFQRGLSDTPFQWPKQNFSPFDIPSSSSTLRDSSSLVSSTNTDAFRPISSFVMMESDPMQLEGLFMDTSDPFEPT